MAKAVSPEAVMHDPAEEDENELRLRMDEDMRSLRWTAFIEIVQNFAETEGFSGVVAAVARAMKEDEQCQKNFSPGR